MIFYGIEASSFRGNTSDILGIYDRCAPAKECDRAVADAIQMYITKNISVLTDGLINNTPTISTELRAYICRPYNISDKDFGDIKKTKVWSYMSKLGSVLKIGLIISYARTKNPIYLNFLCIHIYSSLLIKYFPRGGFDKHIMKYTIDTSDGRTDFKKFNNSLILVVTKKVESFIKAGGKKVSSSPSDREILYVLQSLSTRMNEMMKVIAKNYYINFEDPYLKVQMQYSKTKDGKHVVDGAGVFETIRSKAVDLLNGVNNTAMDGIGLGMGNRSKIGYRSIILNTLTDLFKDSSVIVSGLLDEWMKRNTKDLTLRNFRLTFVKQMSSARNITYIYKRLDSMIQSMCEMEPQISVNKTDLRKYLYNYHIFIVYYASSIVCGNV